LSAKPPTRTAAEDFSANDDLGVSASGHARLKYHGADNQLQVSLDGAAYQSIGGTLEGAYTAGGTGGGAVTLTDDGGPLTLSFGPNPYPTLADGLTLTNPTAATQPSPYQLSPAIRQESRAWDDGTSASVLTWTKQLTFGGFDPAVGGVWPAWQLYGRNGNTGADDLLLSLFESGPLTYLSVGNQTLHIAAGSVEGTNEYIFSDTSLSPLSVADLGTSAARWGVGFLGSLDITGDAAVSTAGAGSIRYNAGLNKFEQSLNAAAYTDLGTVTQVNTGDGLSGGPFTGSGTVDLDLYASGGLSKTVGTGHQLGIAALGVSNAMLANSSVTLTNGTGISISGSPLSLGGTATITNSGVTSNVAGTGIGVSGATGAVTVSNTGVTSNVAGSGIAVSGATGAVTISIPAGGVTASMLAATAVTAGSYGDATHVGTFTVDAQGRLTAAASTAITGLAESAITNLVSDLAAKAPLASPTFTGTVTLPATLSFAANTVGTSASSATNTAGLSLSANVTDGASSVAWALNNSATLTSTARLLSVRNNTTEKFGVIASGGAIAPTIGPSATQQHTLPAVTSDTVMLLAATQEATNKTMTAQVIKTGLTASGSASHDFSGSSGAFVFPSGNVSYTGASTKTVSMVTTGSGSSMTLTAGADSTWSTAAGALTLTSAAATTWGTAAGALTINGFGGINLQVNGTTVADVGVVSASAVTLAANKSLSGAAGTGALSLGSMTGATALPTGNLSYAGASTKTVSLVTTGSGSSMTLTAGADSTWSTSAGALTLTSAAAATWSTAAGALSVDSAAALNLGKTNATSIAMGRSGITTTVTGGFSQLTGAVSLHANAASDFTVSSGALTFDSAAAINIGQTNATSVAIGKSGITTTVTGGLTQLTGAFSLTGNADSSISMVNAAAGVSAVNMTITGGAGGDGSGAAGKVGGTVSITAGAGGAAVSGFAAGVGGGLTIKPGAGGAAVAGQASGAGGVLSLTGADAGAIGAGTGGSGGAIAIRSGIPSGSGGTAGRVDIDTGTVVGGGTAGTIGIGTLSNSALTIQIGRAGVTNTLTGTCQLLGNVTLGNSSGNILTFTGAIGNTLNYSQNANTVTQTAQAAEVVSNGFSWTSGTGGASAGSAAGGAGGIFRLAAGIGGAGDSTHAAGAGGLASLIGGTAGAASGTGGAGVGGGALVQAGPGSAATSTGTGGVGGTSTFQGGTGGAGTGAQVSAVGGVAAIVGGTAGASGGAGGANGGAVAIDGGAATGAGTAGAIGIGATRGTVNIGKSGGSIGHFGATAVAQPTASADVSISAAGSTNTVFRDTTFTGGTGSSAYSVGGLVLALKNLGLIAA
jgi:hypothetical protein